MRKLRQHAKTATKLALLFAMTLSLSTPYSIYANDGESNQTSEQAASTVQPATENQEVENPLPEEPQTEVPETVKSISEQEKAKELEEQQLTEKQASEAQLRNADITKPVIDKVEFPSNGKILKQGESAPIYITAHDDGDGIKEVYVRYSYGYDNDTYESNDSLELIYNKQTGRYEGEIPAVEGNYTREWIYNITAVDKAGNYVNAEVSEENTSNYLYMFHIEVSDKKPIEYDIDTLSITQQGQTLTEGDMLQVRIEFKEVPSKIRRLNLTFVDKKSGESIHFSNFDHDGNLYQGSDTIRRQQSGTYVLSYISAFGNNEEPIDIVYDNLDQIWFSVEGVETDKESPVITSIEMDKKGQLLKAGDTVNFVIKAKDNIELKYDYSYLYLRPVADIQFSYSPIDLIYHKEDDTFRGSYTIADDMYPCEWYIYEIDIRDTSENYTDLYSFTGSPERSSYYFNVQKDGTFTNPSYDVDITFSAMNDYGNYENVKEWKKEKVLRRTTLKEAGVTFPDASTSFGGLVFKGWQDSNGKVVDSNYQITEDSKYITFYAVYDKLVINVTYLYPNKTLDAESKSKKVIVPYGTTYRELLNDLVKDAPKDIYSDVNFSNWQYTDYSLSQYESIDNVIPYYADASLDVEAEFENKVVVKVYQEYFNKDGISNSRNNFILLDKGTTYGELFKTLREKDAPESYEGLRFKKWTIEAYNGDYLDEDVIEKNYDYIHAKAEYENCLVRFLIDPYFNFTHMQGRKGGIGFIDENIEYRKCMVVESGEKIEIPEFPEYKSVTWIFHKPEGENLIITEHTDFLGYGEKSDSKVDPDDTDKEEKPDNKPDDNKNETTPSKKLDQETIKEIINEVKKTPAGKTVEVDMGQASVVPEEVLESIKGKDVTVNLNMGAYTWSINGKDIKSLDLKSIDLEVKFDSDAVPSKLIKDLAGDQPVKKLSLTHNGDFGFKANLTFNIGKEYEGKYGNLYYYDSEGRLVFMNAGKIDANGNVGLAFSHASEYVIVIADKAATENNTNDDTNNTDNTSNGSQPDETKGKGGKADTVKPAVKPADTTKANTAKIDSKTPNTGDSTNNNAFVMLLLVSGVAIALIAWNRKRHVNEAE